MLCPRPHKVSCGFVCRHIVYVFVILLGSSSVRRATVGNQTKKSTRRAGGGGEYRNQAAARPGGAPEPLPPSQTRGGGGRRPPASKWWWGWREGGVSEICKNVCADTRTTTEACPPPELNARRDEISRAGKPLTSIRGIAEYNCNV